MDIKQDLEKLDIKSLKVGEKIETENLSVEKISKDLVKGSAVTINEESLNQFRSISNIS